MTARSIVFPGATEVGRLTGEAPAIWLPLSKTRLYEFVQVQVPIFFTRQILVKTAPGATRLPSVLTLYQQLAAPHATPGSSATPRLRTSSR